MKFSEKFKKNKGEAAVPETAQDSGKKKHKPDPKKLVGTISKKHIKNGSYSMAMAAVFTGVSYLFVMKDIDKKYDSKTPTAPIS